MIVTGILLKSDDIRIVTLSGTRENHNRIADRIHKLQLPISTTQDDITVFVQTLRAFCSDNQVDLACINQRNHTGKHAGGAATFRNEGIIFASLSIPVRLVHPSTMAATERRQSALKTSRPEARELGTAYDLAFEGLE